MFKEEIARVTKELEEAKKEKVAAAPAESEGKGQQKEIPSSAEGGEENGLSRLAGKSNKPLFHLQTHPVSETS